MKAQAVVLVGACMISGTVLAAPIEDWQLNDASGTLLTNVLNSAGTAAWSLTSGTNPDTNGSGQLTLAASNVSETGLLHANIADLVAGTYQLDITGITFGTSALGGGTDDYLSFGFTDANDSTNPRSYATPGSNSRDKAFLVIGNENNSSGIDLMIASHGTTTLVRDVTANFGGTYDLRIVLNATGKTADFYFQSNGGGYTQVGSQLSYADTDAASYLVFNYSFSNSNGGDYALVDRITLVPEPLSAGMLALAPLGLLRRRR